MVGRTGIWYGGGGYVFRLRDDLETMINKTYQLEKEAWIDRYTRAIFIEFTVYNVGTNLFSVNYLLLEKPSSSSFYNTWRFVSV